MNTNSSQYNLTLRLVSLFALPSRFIARIRKIDDMFNHDLDAQSAAFTAAATAAGHGHAGTRFHTTRPPPTPNNLSNFVAMPGPLAFLTSGYAVGLVAMALLLNRIQHIVVPPRRSFTYRLIRSRRSLFHAFFYTVFPIDLSSTAYRLTLRIPSLFFLFKSLALLTVILLQVSSIFPSTENAWLQVIGKWASQKEMSDVCWSTFGAVCLALVVGALTRGLEGLHSSNTSPFNLFGYAMLLHIYSVPFTHATRGPPSRPDKNVILTILLPLLQLSMIHFLGVKKRWSRYRLVPTSICSLLTLSHFNYVILTKPSTYPLLNYLPCLLETILLIVTALACTLNAFTQLLLEGEIRRPLFGHTRSLAPKWDEDFAVVLLRLGTASLEATNVAGLGNELGPITVNNARELDTQTKGGKKTSADEGIVELSSAGVVSVSAAKSRGVSRRPSGGFTNEIKNVKVNSNDGEWLVDHTWLRELARYGMCLFAVVRGFCRIFLWFVWYRWRGSSFGELCADDRSKPDAPKQLSPITRAVTPGAMEDDDILYSRFLRGENVSDDEDEYVPREPAEEFVTGSPYDSIDPSDAEDEPETETEDFDGNGKETAGLFSDLLSTPMASSTVPGPVLIAHMTASSASPLTRRRYNQLVADPRRYVSPSAGEDEGSSEWVEFVRDQRAKANASTVPIVDEPDSYASDSRRNCVVCTSEPREIICWPCRCLALCDDCRENLASRLSASKHSCPCCRRSVEGYSRIYIP